MEAFRPVREALLAPLAEAFLDNHRADPCQVAALVLADYALALGEYGEEQLPRPERERLAATLLRWYRDDPDLGVHAAVGWLLRHDREGITPRPLNWGLARALEQIDREAAERTRAGQVAAVA